MPGYRCRRAIGSERVIFALMIVWILLIPTRADIRKDCRRESKVSWDSLRRLKSGRFDENDHKMKCYLRCFMMKNGILNKNTEIDVQRALRHLPQSMHHSSKEIFDKCKFVSGNDPCDKAFQIGKCYVKFCPELVHNVPFV